MPNPLKGEAQLTLKDGRQFTLVADFDGLIEAETALGKPLAQVLAEANAGFMGAVRALLWGALRRHHRELTLSDVGEIMLADQSGAMEAISLALDAAMPQAEGDNPGNAKPRQAGKRSSGSGAKPG